MPRNSPQFPKNREARGTHILDSANPHASTLRKPYDATAMDWGTRHDSVGSANQESRDPRSREEREIRERICTDRPWMICVSEVRRAAASRRRRLEDRRGGKGRWNGNRWAEIWSGTPDKQIRLNYGKFLISLKKLRLISLQKLRFSYLSSFLFFYPYSHLLFNLRLNGVK
jgi:hypothetical protein